MSDVQRWKILEEGVPHGGITLHAVGEPDGPWMHYADHERVVAEMEQAHAAAVAHITELLNRQKITHAELIGPQHPVLIEVSRVEAAIAEVGSADREPAQKAAPVDAGRNALERLASAAFAYGEGYEDALKPRTLTADERDRIATVLRNNGFDSGTDMHASWRCEDKDRYPEPCNCLVLLVDDIAAALIHDSGKEE